MKLTLTLFCSFISCSVFSQPDTTRRDTSWPASPHRPFLLSIMHAPVLEGRATAVTIVPRERICFDKIFKIKTQTASGPAEGCLFIKIQKGVLAMIDEALKTNTALKIKIVGHTDADKPADNLSLLKRRADAVSL